MSIKEFLNKKPTVSQMLQYIEEQAQLEVKRRKAQAQGGTL